jgi:hypothetical protein
VVVAVAVAEQLFRRVADSVWCHDIGNK